MWLIPFSWLLLFSTPPPNAWFRPSLDEALQWRDSLDKLLQNNCKLELSFIKGQGRDRGKKNTFVLPVSFFSNSDISSIFQSGLSKGRMSRECGHPAHEKRKVYLHWKTDNVKIKCPEDSGLHVVFPSVLLTHVAWPVCLMFSSVKERYCLFQLSLRTAWQGLARAMCRSLDKEARVGDYVPVQAALHFFCGQTWIVLSPSLGFLFWCLPFYLHSRHDKSACKSPFPN